jgi:hypothetical protein
MEFFATLAVGFVAGVCFGRAYQIFAHQNEIPKERCDHPDVYGVKAAMAKCCATIAEAEGMRLGGTAGADIGRGIAATIRREFPA